MRIQQHIFLLLLFIGVKATAQIHLPLSNYYISSVERIALTDSSKSYFNSHLSFKPFLDKRTDTDALYAKEGKHYYWITQKLFKENFIIFKGEDFWVTIDPIIDLELGTDFSADSLERLYWNTRGIRIQGQFLEKVGFTTTIYENQAFLPGYQSVYADEHGEFFPNSNKTKYIQNNAVIPGYSRTKPFKQTGFDFALAEGNVSYVPNEFVNFQAGNGNHFVGNGYRSLLLSDFTTNYPFAKIETNLFQGRLQYNVIYAIHQNLYRLIEYTTPEATYEKKIGTYQYLDFAVNENLQIGLFEGSLWRRVDSLGSYTPNPMLINPLIGLNSAVNGTESEGFNSIFGINVAYSIGSNLIYGQAVIDNEEIGGYQLGFKAYNFITEHLDINAEFNHVGLNTYLSQEKRYNYSHYNLPLAHPFVNGFNELSIQIAYEKNNFFINNRINYSQRIQNDSTRIGNEILYGKYPAENEFNRNTYIVYNQLEIGYRLNKNYNLEAFVGHLYRNETQPTNFPLTNYVYGGIRTRLKNKYLDY